MRGTSSEPVGSRGKVRGACLAGVLVIAVLFTALLGPHFVDWTDYRGHFERFAQSDMAQPGIDAEVHSVMMLISTFLWPVFGRAHARTAKERQQMAKRYSHEMLRLSLYGTMRPEKFPELDAKMRKAVGTRKRSG